MVVIGGDWQAIGGVARGWMNGAVVTHIVHPVIEHTGQGLGG